MPSVYTHNSHTYTHTHTHMGVHPPQTRRRAAALFHWDPIQEAKGSTHGRGKGCASSSADLILTLAERLLFPLYQNVVERIVAYGLRQALDPFLLILLRCGRHAINSVLALHHLRDKRESLAHTSIYISISFATLYIPCPRSQSCMPW